MCYNLNKLIKKGETMIAIVLGAIVIIIFVIIIVSLFAIPSAWLLMLLLGALSHILDVPSLALSFLACYVILLIISVVFNINLRG